nr:MAG TPA: hypothetical protein [Caudoviricetes sp.]
MISSCVYCYRKHVSQYICLLYYAITSQNINGLMIIGHI